MANETPTVDVLDCASKKTGNVNRLLHEQLLLSFDLRSKTQRSLIH